MTTRTTGTAAGTDPTAAPAAGPGRTGRALRRPRVLLTGILLVALWAVVLRGLETVCVAGPWQWRALCVFAVTVLVTSAVATVRLRAHGNTALAVGAGAGVLAWVVLVLVSGHAGDWVLHPAGTVDGVLQILRTTATPFDPSGPVEDLLLTMALLVSVAVASASVGVGVPFAAGGLLSLLLVFPLAVTGVPVDRVLLVAAGVLLVLLAWVATRRFTVSGVAVAALAAVVTVTVVSAMPAAPDRTWNPSVVKPPVGSSVPDVTVELAADIRAGSDTRVFSYATDAPGTDYFPLAGLADFDGGRWTPTDTADPSGSTLEDAWPGARGAGTGVPSGDPAGETHQVTVDIDGLRSEWLPLPEGAEQVTSVDPDVDDGRDWSGAGTGGDVTFDPGDWRWMADSATARADRTVTRDGDRYSATVPGAAAPAAASAEVPAAAPELTDRDRYLALPGAVPAQVSGTAQSVTAGAPDAAAAGQALTDWFHSGAFVYDLSASYRPVAETGDPYEVAETLLTQRRGFCVHYASTFAVMARSLGIPARLMVGYASRSGDGVTQVPADALHAWPQLWVEGTGWVSFEPTPGGPGGADSDMQVQVVPEEGQPGEPPVPPAGAPEESVAPAPGAGAGQSESAEPSETAESPDDPDHDRDGDTAQENGAHQGHGVPVAVVVAVAVLLLLLAPALVRFLAGRWRRRGADRGDHPAQAAWTEFTARAVDLGVLPRKGAGLRARTPEAVVEYLTALPGAGVVAGPDAPSAGSAGFTGPDTFVPAARALAAAVSAERYAGQGAPVKHQELREQLDTATAGLIDLTGTGRRRVSARVRAVFLPASLLPGSAAGK